MNINEAAIRYLAHRPRTELEMKKHLLQKGFDEESVLLEIKALKEARYIDDVSYVEEYIRYGLGKGKAIYRIRYELAQKGVSDFDFEDGLYGYEEANQVDLEQLQVENAMDEANKIVRNASVIDEKLVAKVGRRLNSLGYNSGLIYKILGRIRDQINRDEDF